MANLCTRLFKLLFLYPIDQETQTIFTNKSTARERNEQFIQSHSNTLDHRLVGKLQKLIRAKHCLDVNLIRSKFLGQCIFVFDSVSVFDNDQRFLCTIHCPSKNLAFWHFPNFAAVKNCSLYLIL